MCSLRIWSILRYVYPKLPSNLKLPLWSTCIHLLLPFVCMWYIMMVLGLVVVLGRCTLMHSVLQLLKQGYSYTSSLLHSSFLNWIIMREDSTNFRIYYDLCRLVESSWNPWLSYCHCSFVPWYWFELFNINLWIYYNLKWQATKLFTLLCLDHNKEEHTLLVGMITFKKVDAQASPNIVKTLVCSGSNRNRNLMESWS